ncbi:MAG: RluA family pseudouridine synthase [Candidatus Peregrinibacteria bacterium]
MTLHECIVSEDFAGKRLDVFLSDSLGEQYSRTFIQKLIKDSLVLVNGKCISKVAYIVSEDDSVSASLPEPLADAKLLPENIPLSVLYEDDDVLIINKSSGICVHPDHAHQSKTIVNAALFYCGKSLSGIGGVLRPGIVHRLDKDTSGVLLIAKNDMAHRHFAKEMAERRAKKEYRTLVFGKLKNAEGSVEAPIARDERDRKKMAVSNASHAKPALTHFFLQEVFQDPLVSLLRVHIVTGRTHQIRVHLSSIGFPVVGDETYGNETMNKQFQKDFPLKRIFLHAERLEIAFPNGERKEFYAPLPEDLEKTVNMLEL